MVHCSAINCNSRSEKRVRLFNFPKEIRRRSQWVQNMYREGWSPAPGSRLCERHFDENQWENNRKDGWRKLKPNAVPTLFDPPRPARLNSPTQKALYEALLKDLVKHERQKKARTSSEHIHINPPTSFEENSSPAPAKTLNLNDELARLERENEELKFTNEQQQTQIISMKETIQEFSSKIDVLENQNKLFLNQVLDMQKAQETFLNEAQIKKLHSGRMNEWSNEAIIEGLRLRFALSIYGYKYLLSTGYPSPCYTTLMRRIQDLKFDFGIFYDLCDLLKFKVETMDPDDRFCILSFDEMQIRKKLDLDVSSSRHFGYSTLDSRTMKDDWIPSENDLGDKAFLVIIKGVKHNWEQVIACHITRNEWEKELNEEKKTIFNTEMREIFKKFILDCINVVENCGLYVTTLSSDMDATNTHLWKDLGIEIHPNGRCVNSFIFNDHNIFVHPDPCHLLNKLKSAVLGKTIILPSAYVECEKLPSKYVKGVFVRQLLEYEMHNQAEIRLLQHIQKEDVETTTFDAMGVGSTCRFFSPETASAIKSAIKSKILPVEALTTANFIELISDWFSLISSEVPKKSITKRNCDEKYLFLHRVIDLFQCIHIESDWEPLNEGMILCTSSLCDVVEFLFLEGLDFVLGDRFSNDATENVVSQIRNTFGPSPSALNVLNGVRLISVSQFISDVKRSSYMGTSDTELSSGHNVCSEPSSQHCNTKSRRDLSSLVPGLWGFCST